MGRSLHCKAYYFKEVYSCSNFVWDKSSAKRLDDYSIMLSEMLIICTDNARVWLDSEQAIMLKALCGCTWCAFRLCTHEHRTPGSAAKRCIFMFINAWISHAACLLATWGNELKTLEGNAFEHEWMWEERKRMFPAYNFLYRIGMMKPLLDKAHTVILLIPWVETAEKKSA